MTAVLRHSDGLSVPLQFLPVTPHQEMRTPATGTQQGTHGTHVKASASPVSLTHIYTRVCIYRECVHGI